MTVLENKAIALHGALWLTVDGVSLGGAGRIELLSAIGAHGSITQAAKAVKLSYKAAWDAIDAMNNLAGVALVARFTGGKGGGGTRLTERGQQLVANFKRIEREHQLFVEQLGRQAEGWADDFLLLRRMALKTSARNQFQGVVSKVSPGAVNDEIEVQVTGGHIVVATITHESAVSLGLVVGAAAFALVKAASVMLVTESEGARFSARNQFTGVVSRIHPGAVNTEVVLDLSGGGSVAAIITNHSSERLQLVVGMAATALFKASSVILGVSA